ncbi:hypothetical protein Tco_0467785 [Tanacetum coccineum]
MVPKAVLMRSGLVLLTTAKTVNTAPPKTTVNNARPMTNVFYKAQLTVRRPINNKTTFKNSNINQRVNTVKDKNVNTVRPKAVVNAARPKVVLNAVKGNQGNPQIDLQDQGVIDSGCSRHMTENMSYLTDFEEINGRYVAFEARTNLSQYNTPLSLASSSTKSSSSKGDVLDRGGVSSNVTFKDSSTFIVDVSTALHQIFCGIDCSFNMVLLISCRVRFFLSTTPFDCEV